MSKFFLNSVDFPKRKNGEELGFEWKKLLNKMLEKNPRKRISIKEITNLEFLEIKEEETNMGNFNYNESNVEHVYTQLNKKEVDIRCRIKKG